MLPKIDYHNHTPLCGHATGQPEEYVKQAIKMELDEIGFSDHAPLVAFDDPSVSMKFEELPKYHRLIEEVRDKFTMNHVVNIQASASG